jgi:hypothetical protein
MKKVLVSLLVFFLAFLMIHAANLKPYIMAGVEKGDTASVVKKTENMLKNAGFKIVGAYSPMQDGNRTVICATHELVEKSVLTVGGLTAFGSVIRFGIFRNGDTVEVSYINPLYWANAYYRSDFPRVEKNYRSLAGKISNALNGLEEVRNTGFGSKNGKSVEKLRKYSYMIGMPKFDKVVTIAEKTDHDEMVRRIRKNLASKLGGSVLVYEVGYPGKDLTLFGVGLWGKKGEKKFLPVIDYKQPRHVAFMPYELLVMKDRVVMLHGRFRIALSFPDLTMGTFMKIVSTPGDIVNSMRILTIVK